MLPAKRVSGKKRRVIENCCAAQPYRADLDLAAWRTTKHHIGSISFDASWRSVGNLSYSTFAFGGRGSRFEALFYATVVNGCGCGGYAYIVFEEEAEQRLNRVTRDSI